MHIVEFTSIYCRLSAHHIFVELGFLTKSNWPWLPRFKRMLKYTVDSHGTPYFDNEISDQFHFGLFMHNHKTQFAVRETMQKIDLTFM